MLSSSSNPLTIGRKAPQHYLVSSLFSVWPLSFLSSWGQCTNVCLQPSECPSHDPSPLGFPDNPGVPAPPDCLCVSQFDQRSVTIAPSPTWSPDLPVSSPGSHELSGFSHPGSHFPGCKSSLSHLICDQDPLLMIYLTTGSIYTGWHLHTGTLLLCSELTIDQHLLVFWLKTKLTNRFAHWR